MKTLLLCGAILILLNHPILPQDNFIYCKENNFYEGDSIFYFLGFSAYYLQWTASDSSKKYILDDVLDIVSETGIKVVRTWAYNSGSDNPSQIRYSPYGLREGGLRALDYVVYKAGQYGVKLILALENNYSDFGGLEQYIEWADNYLSPRMGKMYTHNDFFTDDSIKSWYKFYVNTILNRTNVYTGIKYKDDPVILSFELINEASNPGQPVTIVYNWYSEMASYFKSIDRNHLLSTGETGYDNHKENYSDADLYYNSSYFLFNGSKGTSFIENTSIKDIDYSSFHLYPDSWQFESLAGNTWIDNHTAISEGYNKPALLGEFGVVKDKARSYNDYFQTIRGTPSKSAVIWDYVHPDLMNIADRYAFNETTNPDLFDLFKEHLRLEQDTRTPENNDFVLFQNYPNPFNPTTTIKYSLRNSAMIKIELFNSLGELIRVAARGVKGKGTYKIFLSFDNSLLSSGVYFYRLTAIPEGSRAENFIQTRKMILLK